MPILLISLIHNINIVIPVYNNSGTNCEEKLMLFIPQNDLSLLKKHYQYLSSLGLSMEFFGNGINISKIPACLYNKIKESVTMNHNNYIVIIIH